VTKLRGIKAILFDAGNTLIFPDYNIYKRILKKFGVERSIDEIKEAEKISKREFDKKIMNGLGKKEAWLSFFSIFFTYLGLPKEKIQEAFEEVRREQTKGVGIWKVVHRETRELLSKLKKRGFFLGIISNSDGRLKKELRELGLDKFFDVVVDSGEVGVEKPDPSIFGIALKSIGVSAQEAIYVGDYYSVDVKGARAAGLIPVLYDPNGVYQEVDCMKIESLETLLRLL